MNTEQRSTRWPSHYCQQSAALARGEFEDISSFLGAHALSTQDTRIRVFKPGADAVDILCGIGQVSCLRYRNSDLFIADVRQQDIQDGYRLAVNYHGEWFEHEDPYRFGKTLDDYVLYLFNQGQLAEGYRHFGAQVKTIEGVLGVRFAVWAPNAKSLSVIGDFNFWQVNTHLMFKHDCGVWELFVPNVDISARYKFSLLTVSGERIEKSDPYAAALDKPPSTASIVAPPQPTLAACQSRNQTDQPISIYEVHLASWKRKNSEQNDYLSYRELAAELVPYVKMMGFTHIQLMPISEYPFDGSWGYQPIGMFSPTSRFGSIEDFAYFVKQVRSANLGLLIDWVPGHFPSDPHGLSRFDGTHLYEHADRRQGFHPDWNTQIFNFGRAEVKSYLLSSAHYWLDVFGVDGLRVDAVASMLYLDYSRKQDEWVPNQHGGRENIEAIELLQQVNSQLYGKYPSAMMVAEESTAWPGVTKMTDSGGLGFGYKWNMGWMNDSLDYMQKDAVHRQHHHHQMTFSMAYAFDENFVLPLSHDEVVHGKRSLLEKMPGDDWQKFANLRAYYGFMWAHPGKKLLFMGGEFAQRKEWDHDQSLCWHLLEYPIHFGMQQWVKALNHLYRDTPALYQQDHHSEGFSWLNADNHQQSVFSFVRYSAQQHIVVVSNMTPVPRDEYRIGVPELADYKLCLNSDDHQYGGSGHLQSKHFNAEQIPWDGHEQSLQITLPPLATVFLMVEHAQHKRTKDIANGND